MRVSRIVCAVIAITSLLLTSQLFGCNQSTNPISRSEATSYLKKVLPEGKFTVIGEPYKHVVPNRDFNGTLSTTTYTWSAYFDDRPDLTFSVIYTETAYYGDDSPAHQFKTTFNEVYIEHYFSEYNAEYRVGFLGVSFDNDELNCTFANREKLTEGFTQLGDFYQYVQLQQHPCAIPVAFHFEDAALVSNQEWGNEGIDPVFRTDSFDKSTPDVALDAFACFSQEFRIGLDNFSDDELREFAADEYYRLKLLLSDGSQVLYEDLLTVSNGRDISYGTLYELLLRNDFEVSGDFFHFTVIGKDGSTYEFSYSFDDLYVFATDGGDFTGFYCLKDGEQVSTGSFYTTVSDELFHEILGIDFTYADADRPAKDEPPSPPLVS